MFSHIVIHYSEIGLKGKNRGYFENSLIRNIKFSLKEFKIFVFKRYGRIICELKKEAGEENIDKIIENLKNIPGIADFSPALAAGLEMKTIEEKTLALLKGKEFRTFRISARRANKKFGFNSEEINRKMGEAVINKLNKEVSLTAPEVNVFIEVGEKEVFIFSEKIKGLGGLPVGSSGKVVCSLSGGIDSPVAGFLMMKRGCEAIFVHIHNQSLAQKNVEDKIKELVKILSKFQNFGAKLYIAHFSEIQKQIIIFIPAKFRMLIYRRFMMKIINKIAEIEKAKAIITGDNVGQVASQTLENLNSIYKASNLPVISPLAGMNKEEIIGLAKKIRTYDSSIMPYPDCCSFMIAEHPATKSSPEEIETLEEKIPEKEKLIDEAVKKAKIEVV